MEVIKKGKEVDETKQWWWQVLAAKTSSSNHQ
jgi:hypothetical protein